MKIVAILLLAILTFSCSDDDEKGTEENKGQWAMIFNETIKSEEKILVDFWATWCGPCMRQAPILEELAGEGYHIGKVDVDQAPDLAGNYRVMSIPTLILFKNGEEVKRFIGLQTKDTLKALLDAE